MVDEALHEMSLAMQKAVDGLAQQLTTIRTGRATPALIENLKIDYHGVAMPLQHLASISTSGAGLIVVQPWERASLKSIEKAILKSDLGLNPTNDGSVLRVVIPPLSEERRVELVKVVSKRVEERRVTLRNLRRDGVEKLRQAERSKDISQDDLSSALKKVQEITDAFTEKVHLIGQDKEKELREL